MEPTTVMRERLRDAPWALELTAPQLQRVVHDTQVARHTSGSVVCHEGAPAHHWIGVLDGMVKVDTASTDGRGTSFAGVSSGGWLGEGSLLKGELRPYEVVALHDSWIAFMPRDVFLWLFETSLPFNHFLVRQLNARLGQFIAVVESGRIQTTTAQVAVCLSALFDPTFSFRLARSPQLQQLQLSHEEIARLCGLSRQVVGRALHALEQAGLVRLQYGTIQVLDFAGLQEFSRDRTGG